MSENFFASAPLISTGRLQADRAGAFDILPSWASGGTLVGHDFPLEQDAFVVYVGTTKPMPLILYVLSAAILIELTRYGNNITTNSNRTARSAIAKVYAKLTFASAPEDNMPASRIVMAAGPRQAVIHADDRGDLRPELLAMRGDGKATKDAREVAIKHSAGLARAAGADVDAYVANLWALIGWHDTVHLEAANY
jgi:hypothetical protein